MKKEQTPAAKTGESEKQRQSASFYIRAKPRHKFRRRITPEDAADFARLMALRITDQEACGMLGLSVTGWRQWRARHPEFEDLYAQIRGAKIEAHMGNIESQAPEDWRASQAWLQLTSPERYSARALAFAEQPTIVNTVNVELFNQAVTLIYGLDAMKAIPPQPARQALPAPPETTSSGVKHLLEILPRDPNKP
jgi:hypothetical protein